MSAPLLRALDLHHPNLLRDPACVPPLPVEPGLRAFLVVGEGSYLGVDYGVGDVLVCRGEPRSGRPTVLVARHGRPRLGSVLGQRLLGDAGEACHPGRWRPAGELWALHRRSATAATGWVSRKLHGATEAAAAIGTHAANVPGPVGRVVVRSVVVPTATPQERSAGQLALFAA